MEVFKMLSYTNFLSMNIVSPKPISIGISICFMRMRFSYKKRRKTQTANFNYDDLFLIGIIISRGVKTRAYNIAAIKLCSYVCVSCDILNVLQIFTSMTTHLIEKIIIIKGHVTDHV